MVDDEELNTDMLSRRLTRSGFQVEVAGNGPAALARIASQCFDLVLLDQMMPGMSGREVLERIRQDHSPDMLPVIMVTALAESERVAEALEAGANDYVTKPIDFRITLARINAQLARRDAEQALRVSEERYALASRASRDAIWDWDLEENTFYFSERWIEMLGLTPEQIGNVPDSWFSRVFLADRETLQQCIRTEIASNRGTFDCNYRVQHADGSLRWMSTRAIITRDGHGNAKRISGSQSDVTGEKTQDALTALPNRIALKTRMEHLFLQAQSAKSDAPFPYALLFLDLDGFKAVNDSLGHLAGDQLLSVVAERLRAAGDAFGTERGHARSQLMIARLSGDEFAVLLETEFPKADADAIALQIQNAMRAPVILEGRPVHVTFSIGIAAGSPAHTAYDELLSDADVAMYVAKTIRRGAVASFTPEIREAALNRLTLENDLRSAIDLRQMRLVYQPKVRLHNGTIYGVEALLRWHHPLRGVVAPAEFIAIAEETGLIVEIGRWVLRTACKQILEWHAAYPLQPPLELSVNLSPKEFEQEQLVEEIAAVLHETQFPASSLHLEITETVLFKHFADARSKLLSLRALGIFIDLDDFGSGYSSLRYLRELPFDTLKIDRYFVSSLDHDETASSAQLIQTILAMASTLGLKVVAEGVETLPHSVQLKNLGCEFAQGYHFSRPLAPDDMHDVLRQACRDAELVSASDLTMANTATAAAFLPSPAFS
ncbi:MAG: putative bifunctional diguanylate cyclase/phosphodiesterase [Janthinobacterium lividum]